MSSNSSNTESKKASILRIIIVLFPVAIVITSIIVLGSVFSTENAIPTTVLPARSELSFIIASDLHYLGRSGATASATLFEQQNRGDGKLSMYSPSITDAFISEVIAKRPTALILSGDLSFNGEKVNHSDLATKLRKITAAGIPVLVIPGNHDINRPNTYTYSDEGTKPTAPIDAKVFRDLYFPLGANNAVSFDNYSLSYLYRVSEDMLILMLDTCRYGKDNYSEGGELSEKTLAWITSALADEQKSGDTVISVSHHNMLQHSVLFSSGYTISDYSAVVKQLVELGIRVNFSGHMHTQHIEQEYGLYDIATNSLCVYPNYYGELLISPDQKLSYQTQSVDVEAWAARIASTDENLLHFSEYSRYFMDQTTELGLRERLTSYGLTTADIDAMVDFAVRMTRDYFAGIPINVSPDDRGYQLWTNEFHDDDYANYLYTIYAEKEDSRTFTLE